MANGTRFLGLQYPIVDGPYGLMANSSGLDQIKADMLQLILTNPNERVMLPAFGTPLRQLFFEPNDPTLEAQAKKMISDAITMWEPRIEVQDIIVSYQVDPAELSPKDPGFDTDAVLSVKILFYDPLNINVVDDLTLEIPATGG